MLEELKGEVWEANLALKAAGVVELTFGNVSGLDRAQGLVVIKPSGVAYAGLRPEQMVVLDLEGRIVEGTLRPSSDTPTHLVLYREMTEIGGVAHTHSAYAAAWAQAGRSIPCYGTTHADYFRGAVPLTEQLTAKAIEGEYEKETGLAIARTMTSQSVAEFVGILVASHGPFTWGRSATEAAEHSIILEQIAHIAALTEGLAPMAGPISRELRDKHFRRKHGEAAYYGQDA